MIIAWYPGGGNRFYQSLHKSNFLFELNKIYDHSNPYQHYPNRYPGAKSGQVNTDVVFTHCVNYELIVKTWPGHDEIYIIETDFFKSLRRHWYLAEKTTNANTHPAGGPFSAIVWHKNYYTQYPPDDGDFIRVNQTTFPDFFQMVENELDSIHCPEFDFAQQMFLQYSKDAPILDLYRELYEQR